MIARFVILFGLVFGIALWLLDGDGPVTALNTGIGALTTAQARGAGLLLSATGETVEADGPVLRGPRFSCDVDTGCNGMSAVILLVAGIVCFPATAFRTRLAGILVLVPVVLVLNVVRIAALYWTGAHRPQWLEISHVYFWQTVMIAATAFLWLSWLSWKSRPSVAS
jgi:exosortase/archaeosortase family protein